MRPPRREGRTDQKNSAFKRAMLRAVEAQVAKEGEDPVARLSASFAALDTEQSGQVKTRDLVWLLEELGSAGPGAEGGGGGGEGAEGAEEGGEAGERVLRAAFAGKEAVDLDEFLTAALDWPALKQDEHWDDWARAAFVNIIFTKWLFAADDGPTVQRWMADVGSSCLELRVPSSAAISRDAD